MPQIILFWIELTPYYRYSLSLLRSFYAEGLVDRRTFLAWLVQQTCTCNLAQLGFVARLAEEYLDGMLVSHALTRPFVEACINRLAEVTIYATDQHPRSMELT